MPSALERLLHPLGEPLGGDDGGLQVLGLDLQQVREWARGTTSAWPGVAGLMSMKETVRSSESIVWLGTEPSTIPQKRQSATGGLYSQKDDAARPGRGACLDLIAGRPALLWAAGCGSSGG